jgi:hypothetical protein
MADDERGGGTQGKREAAEKARPWQKPLVWLGGIVVAALGVALTNVLVPEFGKGLSALTETGDPVEINTVSLAQGAGFYMVVPQDVPVLDADVAEVADQDGFFAAHGAVRAGWFEIKIAVRGNRSDKVRIMDIRPVKTCGTPLNGTYFEFPSQGADMAIRVYLNLDLPNPVAMDAPDWEGAADPPPKPYFASNTVSLAKDEQVIFNVGVSVDKLHCDFELEALILEGSTLHKQQITNHGYPFSITPRLPLKQWQRVFLGGVQCEPSILGYRPATQYLIETGDMSPNTACV